MKIKEKIIQLRIEGNSYNQISKILNISKATISYHCIKYNINAPINKRIVMTNEIVVEINNFYKNHTINETTTKFNVSRSTIIKYADNKQKLFNDIEKRERNYLRVKNRRNKLKEMAIDL
jgi:transposase